MFRNLLPGAHTPSLPCLGLLVLAGISGAQAAEEQSADSFSITGPPEAGETVDDPNLDVPPSTPPTTFPGLYNGGDQVAEEQPADRFSIASSPEAGETDDDYSLDAPPSTPPRTLPGHHNIGNSQTTEEPSADSFSITGPPETGETDDDYNLDVPPSTPHKILPGLYIGGRLKLEIGVEENFDLDNQTEDDLAHIEPSLSQAISIMPNNHIMAFLNFEASRAFELVDEADAYSNLTELRLKRAYVQVSDFAEGLSITLGRQKINDSREWYYDETFDAVRLTFEHGPVEVDIALGREEFFDGDLHNNRPLDRINTYIFKSIYAATRDIDISAFVIHRDNRAENDTRLWFLGLRSEGEFEPFGGDLNYWVDIGAVVGTRRTQTTRGYGFDFGATYQFDAAFDPRFTLATAHGSGDSDENDDVDTEFRQTRLEGNEDRFGGVTRFKYYGELLDPVLRNIFIYTLGAGIRPTKKSSVDLIYHYYRQDVVSDRLRGSSIDLDPNEDFDNVSRSLGHEIDLIVGARDVMKNVDVDLTLGYFIPGPAFRREVVKDVFDNADTSFFAGLKIIYNF